MSPPPPLIDGASVRLYAVLEPRHELTGNTRHHVEGALLPPVQGLAICQYESGSDAYLFRCNLSWQVLTDTCHSSIPEAQAQAEFEYKNVSESWRSL